MTVLASQNTPVALPGRRIWFAWLGAGLVLLWAASLRLSGVQLSGLELLQAAFTLAGLGTGVIFWRGFSRLSASAAGRLWTVGWSLCALMLLSPGFWRYSAEHLSIRQILFEPAVFVPLLALAGLTGLHHWTTARAGNSTTAPAATPMLETFLSSFRIRLHLAAAGVILVGAGVALGGFRSVVLFPRALWLCAVILGLRALLKLAGTAPGAGALCLAPGILLAGALAAGLTDYRELHRSVEAGREELHRGRPEEAQAAYARAMELNRILHVAGPEADMERQWAQYYENRGDLTGALRHWNQVAAIQGLAPETFAPVLRVYCRMGDSLVAWRRLVFNGFAAIKEPEMAPGIAALAERPNRDLRSRLLAALAAWERKESEEECRRRLAAVLEISPLDPSAWNLLVRLGAPWPERPLWLHPELLVGQRPTLYSPVGTLEEIGAMETLVVLNGGEWQLDLRTQATPLHEIWPVIRLEVDGHVVGRTQVNRADDHHVPFVFQVKRGHLYRVKIVLENPEEDLEGGRRGRRGVALHGLRLQRISD